MTSFLKLEHVPYIQSTYPIAYRQYNIPFPTPNFNNRYGTITQNENHQARNAKHLIVVAGHSVTISGHLEDAGEDEADWFLLDYQKNQGYVLFARHDRVRAVRFVLSRPKTGEKLLLLLDMMIMFLVHPRFTLYVKPRPYFVLSHHVQSPPSNPSSYQCWYQRGRQRPKLFARI